MKLSVPLKRKWRWGSDMTEDLSEIFEKWNVWRAGEILQW